MTMAKVESNDGPAPPPHSAAVGDLSRLSLSESAANDQSSPEQEQEEDTIPGITFTDYRDERDLDAVMRLVGKDLSEPYSIFTYRYFLHRFPDLCILAVPSGDGGGGEPVGCVVCKVDDEEGVGDGSMLLPTDAPPPEGSAGGEEAAGGGGGEGDGTSVVMAGGEGGGGGSDGAHDDEAALTSGPPPPSTSVGGRSKVLSGYMAMLAVDNTRRKSGIGTALARRAVRRMRERYGCASVSLETEVTNEAAIRLYEDRLGFVREERLVRYYLNWGDAYRLRLWFD